MMRRIVVGLALAVVVVGCGQGEHEIGPQHARLASFSPAQVTTDIAGAMPKQRQVLLEILAGLGSTPLTGIHLGKAEPGWEGAEKNSIELKVLTEDTDWLANWHARIVANALRIRSYQLELPPVNYVSQGNGGSLMADDPERVVAERDLTPSDAQDIAKRIRIAAAEHDVEVRTLELVKPRRFAFVLVLESANAQQFLRDGYEKVLEPLDELGAKGYDGRYVEVCDEKGGIALVAGAASLVRPQTGGAVPNALRCRGSFTRQTPRSSGPVQIEGGSKAQRRLLENIFEGIGPTEISSAKIEPASDFFTPYRPNSVVLRMKFRPGGARRANWEAPMVADAFGDGSRLLGLQPVTAYATPGESVSIDGPDLQPVVMASLRPSELEGEIRTAAREADAELVDLEILKPRLLAPIFTLKVSDPADFLRNRMRIIFWAIEPLDVAGYLVRLVDEDGQLVWSTIDGIVRPELEGCDPIVPYGGPPIPPPPPCPANYSPSKQ